MSACVLQGEVSIPVPMIKMFYFVRIIAHTDWPEETNTLLQLAIESHLLKIPGNF